MSKTFFNLLMIVFMLTGLVPDEFIIGMLMCALYFYD